jgi:hypothetical protein
LQIGVENLSTNVFGRRNDLLRGEDAHPPDFRVKGDQCGNVGLIVLQRVDISISRPPR